jgi:predicted RNA methylase
MRHGQFEYHVKISIAVIFILIIAQALYGRLTGQIGENGCPKGQTAISGYNAGRYTHMCVEPGALNPATVTQSP